MAWHRIASVRRTSELNVWEVDNEVDLNGFSICRSGDWVLNRATREWFFLIAPGKRIFIAKEPPH